MHRLTALGRAHDLVRPVPQPDRDGRAVRRSAFGAADADDDLGAFSGRIRVSVPRMEIGEAAATNLALVLHELATNSIKHGALISNSGLLDVACLVDDGVASIVWTERGEPKEQGPSAAKGFGSQPLHRTMTHHFAGEVSYEWASDGLIATLKIHAAKLET